ncbi:MAG: kynureninase [Betaproteobacteria bacterium]|nr:kynureninase [Betaproteobacteria bacterium]
MSSPLSRTRTECEALDRADPLAFARKRFLLPEGVVYLDGNSLGALPATTANCLQDTVRHEWGVGLIRSWNDADWVALPKRIGSTIAALLGAQENEIIATDSTSINIFKILAGALSLASKQDNSRRVILSERDNFPTDLYISQGINATFGNAYELRLVDENIESAFNDRVAVALVTQVDYRTGRMHNMARLNKLAREAGTRVVWDLSHSAGAVPVELNKNGAELAAGCGYKYLNGGPGAPAYLYVASALQADFPTPLSGWFGHAAPFDFKPDYLPAPGIERFQCGTPSVLAMLALGCGLATFADVSMDELRDKSLRLSDLFWQLMDEQCGEFGFACVSPREHAIRGSQLSFAHEHASAIMQALIDRGVIGDFRQPNLLRFGFTPLYLRYTDVCDAVKVIREVMQCGAWKATRFQQRKQVT